MCRIIYGSNSVNNRAFSVSSPKKKGGPASSSTFDHQTLPLVITWILDYNPCPDLLLGSGISLWDKVDKKGDNEEEDEALSYLKNSIYLDGAVT